MRNDTRRGAADGADSAQVVSSVGAGVESVEAVDPVEAPEVLMAIRLLWRPLRHSAGHTVGAHISMRSLRP